MSTILGSTSKAQEGNSSHIYPGYGAMGDAGISPAVGIAGHGGIPGMPALPSPTVAHKYQVGLNFCVVVGTQHTEENQKTKLKMYVRA